MIQNKPEYPIPIHQSTINTLSEVERMFVDLFVKERKYIVIVDD